MVISFLATATCATAAPLNPNYKKEEVSYYYEDTKACALITLAGSEVAAAYEAILPGMAIIQAVMDEQGKLSFELKSGKREARAHSIASCDDVAMILHTSGTTSRPKRVPNPPF